MVNGVFRLTDVYHNFIKMAKENKPLIQEDFMFEFTKEEFRK